MDNNEESNDLPEDLQDLNISSPASNPSTPHPDRPESVSDEILRELNPQDPNSVRDLSLNLSVNSVPVASPDEIVIRNRGRRKISLSWSPMKTPMRSSSSNSTMTLRSSPRKRIFMSEYSPSSRSLEKPRTPNPSPYKAPNPTVLMRYTSKRLRYEDTPVARRLRTTPLNQILSGLEKNQLIGIIEDLVRKEPRYEEEIRRNLPMADIRRISEKLKTLAKTIHRTIPTTRLINKVDVSSYGKAAPYMLMMKQAILKHTQALAKSKHWDSLLDYCIIAWRILKRLPTWDNSSYNRLRNACYRAIASASHSALQNGSSELGQKRLLELGQNINEMFEDMPDLAETVTLFKKMDISIDGHEEF